MEKKVSTVCVGSREEQLNLGNWGRGYAEEEIRKCGNEGRWLLSGRGYRVLSRDIVVKYY